MKMASQEINYDERHNDNISEVELKWNYNWDKMKGNGKLMHELLKPQFLDEIKRKVELR